MEYLELIKTALEKEKFELAKHLGKADKNRLESPVSTESHSDTTRARYEQLIASLKEKIKILDDQISSISKLTPWKYFEIKSSKGMVKYILAPNGFGGRKIEEVLLVSAGAPIGQKLINISENESFSVNGQDYVVIRVVNLIN